jgi:hypothetical protein
MTLIMNQHRTKFESINLQISNLENQTQTNSVEIANLNAQFSNLRSEMFTEFYAFAEMIQQSQSEMNGKLIEMCASVQELKKMKESFERHEVVELSDSENDPALGTAEKEKIPKEGTKGYSLPFDWKPEVLQTISLESYSRVRV